MLFFESPLGGLPLEYEEQWTGGYIFENEWQSFRTRLSRDLELISADHSYDRPGRYTVVVKLIWARRPPWSGRSATAASLDHQLAAALHACLSLENRAVV